MPRMSPRINKSDMFFGSQETRLRFAMTLRYLATGDSYKSPQFSSCVAHNTASNKVPENFQVIVKEYIEEVLSSPRPFIDFTFSS